MADDLSPPDDAYGRVTNAERFRPLHGVVRSMAEELARDFDADVDEVAGDGGLEWSFPDVEAVVRVTPASDGASPLTFALTGFPGVHARAGRWVQAGFPACGCDACGDGCDEVVEGLRRFVDGVVSGGFVEWWDGSRLGHSFPGGSSGWSMQTPARWAVLGPPADHRWAPWPRRPGSSG